MYLRFSCCFWKFALCLIFIPWEAFCLFSLIVAKLFFFYWFTIILWCLLFTVIFIFIFAIFWGSFWIDQIFFFNPPFPLLFIFEVIYLLHFLVLYLTFNVCTCFIAFKKPELVIFFRLLLKTGNFYLVFNHGYILKI